MRRPNWTVIAHIPGEFVGFSVQFFRDEKLAQAYYDLQNKLGNTVTKRPFYLHSDAQYMNPVDAAALGVDPVPRPDYGSHVCVNGKTKPYHKLFCSMCPPEGASNEPNTP